MEIFLFERFITYLPLSPLPLCPFSSARKQKESSQYENPVSMLESQEVHFQFHTANMACLCFHVSHTVNIWPLLSGVSNGQYNLCLVPGVPHSNCELCLFVSVSHNMACLCLQVFHTVNMTCRYFTQ